MCYHTCKVILAALDASYSAWHGLFYPLNLDHIMALRYPHITRQADKPLYISLEICSYYKIGPRQIANTRAPKN
jgi:hypothetical protein